MNNQKENTKRTQLHKYVQFTGMAFQMGIVITFFTILGIWLDDKNPNEYSLYTVLCSLFGVFASLYLVIRQVQKINKKTEKKNTN